MTIFKVVSIICPILLLLFPGSSRCESPDDSGFTPRITGIGVALGIDEGYPKVRFIVPNGAADKSKKLRVNDKITSVKNKESHVDTRGMNMEQIVSLIRGPIDSIVELKILRDKQVRQIQITRAAVPLSKFKFNVKFEKNKLPDVAVFDMQLGKSQKLSDYTGEILVLDAWATGCAPCQKPMQEMQKYYLNNPAWKEKVKLIGANIDNDIDRAKDHIQKRGWNSITHIHLPKKALEKLKIEVVPTLIITDGELNVIYYGDIHNVDIESFVNQRLN